MSVRRGTAQAKGVAPIHVWPGGRPKIWLTQPAMDLLDLLDKVQGAAELQAQGATYTDAAWRAAYLVVGRKVLEDPAEEVIRLRRLKLLTRAWSLRQIQHVLEQIETEVLAAARKIVRSAKPPRVNWRGPRRLGMISSIGSNPAMSYQARLCALVELRAEDLQAALDRLQVYESVRMADGARANPASQVRPRTTQMLIRTALRLQVELAN